MAWRRRAGEGCARLGIAAAVLGPAACASPSDAPAATVAGRRRAWPAAVPLVAGAAVLGLAGCVPHTPPTSPAAFDHSWQIVGHRFPGVSAIGDRDASRWHGRFVHLQAQRAANGVETCDRATYVERVHAATPFLDAEYRVAAAALGVDGDTAVRVIEVQCDGRPWAALGGRVLSFGDAGEFAVWDGVFFVLRRTHL